MPPLCLFKPVRSFASGRSVFINASAQLHQARQRRFHFLSAAKNPAPVCRMQAYYIKSLFFEILLWIKPKNI